MKYYNSQNNVMYMLLSWQWKKFCSTCNSRSRERWTHAQPLSPFYPLQDASPICFKHAMIFDEVTKSQKQISCPQLLIDDQLHAYKFGF